MSTIDAGRHTVWHRIWGAWLAVLGVAGAWQFAAAPAELLRRHWLSSLAWLLTLACCGVAAEANWTGRPYRSGASLALLWSTMLIGVLVLYLAVSTAMPGTSLLVLLALFVTSFLLVTQDPGRPRKTGAGGKRP